MKKKEDSSSALRYRMTHAKLMERIKGLESVFDIVRIVAPSA
ncbi:MAG: hypothetical protein ACFWTM_00610 [Mitsuokella multacida]|jgi:hypothetical protein